MSTKEKALVAVQGNESKSDEDKARLDDITSSAFVNLLSRVELLEGQIAMMASLIGRLEVQADEARDWGKEWAS